MQALASTRLMKNYLPAGARENRVEVIVQKRLQQYRQPAVLGQILHLHRFHSVTDLAVPANIIDENSQRHNEKIATRVHETQLLLAK